VVVMGWGGCTFSDYMHEWKVLVYSTNKVRVLLNSSSGAYIYYLKCHLGWLSFLKYKVNEFSKSEDD
jgi:hypothetical protein